MHTIRRPQNNIFIGILGPFEGSQAIPDEFLVRSRNRSRYSIARIGGVAIAQGILLGVVRARSIIGARSSLNLLSSSRRGPIRVVIIRGIGGRVILNIRALTTSRNLDIIASPLHAKSDCLNGALLEQECGGNNELNSYACALAENFHSTGPSSRRQSSKFKLTPVREPNVEQQMRAAVFRQRTGQYIFQ